MGESIEVSVGRVLITRLGYFSGSGGNYLSMQREIKSDHSWQCVWSVTDVQCL